MMSRTEIVPTENGVVIKSKLQVDSSFVNKIENPVNKDRIRAHLKDMKAEHEIVGKDTPFSVLSMSIYEPMDREDFDRILRVLVANHDAFFENVSERMPEVQLKEETQDEEGNEKISAVTDLLKSIDQFESDEYVVITDRIGFIGIALGKINVGLLREILDTYVDKHMSK